MTLFQIQNAKAKIGEALVESYLDSLGLYVSNVSENKEYFDRDIDFLYSDGEEWSSLDVKYDDCIDTTGNLFIEYDLCYDNGSKPGWIKYCQAEFIYYVNAANNQCLIFKTEEMKDYVENNYCKTGVCNDKFKLARGYLVPALEYKQSGNYYKVIDLNGAE